MQLSFKFRSFAAPTAH